MDHSHSELWRKLEVLDLDGNSQLSFSQRLARDNGWTDDFTRRVVLEYKRFVFLAATAGHPVTPSDEVDQAWHLHLVYTRSYWDELCGEVLGFPLHHGPTKGGTSEGAKFGDWYARTLESYRLAFGEEAPHDIWPDAKVRFGEAPHFRRVNTRRVWMVRKPEWVVRFKRPKMQMPNRAVLVGRFAPVLLLLLIAGCVSPTNLNVSQLSGAEFLGASWRACAVGVALVVFLKNREFPPLDPVFPINPLDAYEIARLKEDGSLAVDVALAVLHERGAVEVTDRGAIRTTGDNQPRHPFERAVLERVGEENSVLAIRAGVKNDLLARPLEAIDQKLREAGLLVSPEVAKSANLAPLLIILALLAVGVIRIFVGIARDRPVGFLVLSCFVLLGFAIWVGTTAPRRSKRGNLLLQNLNAQYNSSRAPLPSIRADNFAASASGGNVETAAILFALVGPTMFPTDIRRAVAPPSSSSGSDGGTGCSSSSSGGDSGGSDGGSGCGGCGGCGGGGGD